MLQVRGLTVRYGATNAVADAELTVASGTVLALLGPSGCGKSTLLRAVAGLEHPVGGEIRWRGVDLAEVPIHRRRFGLMFQDGVLFPHRTVAGNVSYGLRGQSRDRTDERVTDLLAMVGLPGYGPRRVTTLSGGEAQRIALARALAPEPDLLLLDEPLAALDRALRDGLLADLRRVLRATGTTAIFVTHDQAEAFAVADRLALMRGGRIVQEGPPHQVWQHPGDETSARFLGVTHMIGNRDPLRPLFGLGDGGVLGLRPAALVVEPDGPLTAEIVDAVPGPERARLTIRGLRRRAEIDDATAGGSSAAPPGGSRMFAAVGPAAAELVGTVNLRIDDRQIARIGAGAS